jgi:hypothetical protein
VELAPHVEFRSLVTFVAEYSLNRVLGVRWPGIALDFSA